MENNNSISSNRSRAHDAAAPRTTTERPQPPVVVNLPTHRMLYDMNHVISSFFTTVSEMTSQPLIPASVMQETMAFLINPLAKSKELRTSFVPPIVVAPAIKSSSSAFSVYQQKSQEQIPAVRQENSEKPIEQSSQHSTSIASSSTTVKLAINTTLSAFKVYQQKGKEQIPAVQQETSENPIEQSTPIASSSSTTVAPGVNTTLSAFRVYQRPNQAVPAVHHDIFGNLRATTAIAGNTAQNARDCTQVRQKEGPSAPKRQRME